MTMYAAHRPMDGVFNGEGRGRPGPHLHRRGPREPEAGAAAEASTEEGAGASAISQHQPGAHGGGTHASWRGGGMLLIGHRVDDAG